MNENIEKNYDTYQSKYQNTNSNIMQQSKYINKDFSTSKFNDNSMRGNDNFTLNNNKYDGFDPNQYDNKITTDSIKNKVTNIELKSNDYIKFHIETEFSKMRTYVKQCVHEEIQSLHVDLIRQFEIQQVI